MLLATIPEFLRRRDDSFRIAEGMITSTSMLNHNNDKVARGLVRSPTYLS